MSTPLEPDSSQRAELSSRVSEFVERWFAEMGSMDASGNDLGEEDLAALMATPGEEGVEIDAILANLALAGQSGIYHPSGGHMSYIPNSGLYTGALGELLASALNRYTGVTGAAPGMTAIENSVTNWITGLFDLGDAATAILLSGGSMANFTAIAAARTNRMGERFDLGTVYLTGHTHHSVAKSARLAGLRNDQIRLVPVDGHLRMRADSLEQMVKQDAASGLRPFLVVASAGTTDTGTIDDLEAVGAVARDYDLWMHTDGAYGGFFQLTRRGRHRFSGIDLSDSIALDPHKGLSIPFGVGALVVKDRNHLIDANYGRAAYLNHDESYQGMRDISSLGPELTRPFRGLPLWLPLRLHGVAPFRDALDEALDLAVHACRRLRTIEGIRSPWAPDLSIVAVGFDDDEVGRRAMEQVNADRRVHLSSTIVDDRFVLRFAILNRRTTADHVDYAIDIIEKSLIG
ncbi:MAG: aminotransferase class V-fold PLP-dependent enzyme [Acidimicrobiia bacterium]|nr:aminotransferase class V-fold PLP-dependent enzyme [Acidimicrobiia bacterium]MDH3463037.1 aminotransferase class V-fold PLP-dependent enzyme [Acidimicrobiia bacterium]